MPVTYTLAAMQPTDEYATLSAIWILASNDERPLITYRGLRHRLGVPPGYDLESLVRRHGELFRLNMPDSALQPWKAQMKAGTGLPSWLRQMEEPARLKAIEALSPEDGFRSQFRASVAAPRSEVAIIEWGLAHIERLRKAHVEAREATAKSWQMWLVLLTSSLGVVATVLAAIISAKLGHK